MSIIELFDHDEVIYAILDQPPPDREKTPRYESKLEKQLKATKIPKQHRLFGYAETPLRPPSNYLKKGKGMPQPTRKSDHQCCENDHLPPLPKTLPVKKKKEGKPPNFRAINIKNAEKVKTLKNKIEPKEVDSPNGHISRLKGSGKIPEYALSEKFGRVPEYLVKRKMKLWKEFERLKLEDETRESACKAISAEEREQLLQGLKAKWDILQKAFLQLPIMTDTIPKILKKNKMEQKLKELESDIALVTESPYIYVYD